jgi:hypothetical protein
MYGLIFTDVPLLWIDAAGNQAKDPTYSATPAPGRVGGAAYAAAQEAVKKIHEQYPAAMIGEVEQDDSPI